MWIGIPLALGGYPLGCALLGHRPYKRPPDQAALELTALAAVVDAGLFEVDRTHSFTFYTYGDSVEELREYVEENWRNAKISDETMRRTGEALRADPQASAQPLEPWPMFSQMPSTPLAPSTGGPSGSIGRAPFQCWAWPSSAAPGNQSASTRYSVAIAAG